MNLSEYAKKLSPEHLSRYKEKVAIIDNDPYAVSPEKFTDLMNSTKKPDIRYNDIYNYLINKTSAYTGEALKSYKSLEAYRFFVSGWVQSCKLASFVNARDKIYLITASVKHSQRLSEPPLKPWIIAQEDGVILTAHCTCMAGLGEACSHVGGVLFGVECAVRVSSEQTCTDVPCPWIEPAAASAPPARLCDIDFTKASTKQRMIAENATYVRPRRQGATPDIPPPSDQEKHQLYEGLSKTGHKSAVLAVVEPYNEHYQSKVTCPQCPKPLNTLFDQECTALGFDDLLRRCDEEFQKWQLQITYKEVQFVEKSTREQSKCALWHLQRTGRITASILYDTVKTNSDKPSRSLITRICYPAKVHLSTIATRWGCDHEKTARTAYSQHMAQHQDLFIMDSGLVISQTHPCLAASPDGYVNCSCCGTGIIEVKCPYCHRDQDLQEATESKQFCLENVNGVMKLKRTHRYFYQVQTQLYVTEVAYCDFVVWTNQSTHVERIVFDHDFFVEQLKRSLHFHKNVIMPELIGKWFTNNPDLCYRRTDGAQCTVENTDTNIICYCRKPKGDGPVVICQSGICKFNNFHLNCLRLKNLPKRKWLCSDCRTLAKSTKK